MTTTRTTHRSTANRKLYAVRGKDGRFKDVQTYKRASSADQRRTTVAEATKRVVAQARAFYRKFSCTSWLDRRPSDDLPLLQAVEALNGAMAEARARGAK